MWVSEGDNNITFKGKGVNFKIGMEEGNLNYQTYR
jgi:hypothetical protein